MRLNELAGRTYNDLNQYPVFPWILRDYTSETLDLSDASVYRDLSRPMGAQEPEQRELVCRMFDEFTDESIPKFHYGSHYSTMGFVLYYLMRVEPFSSYHKGLQSGRFDHADRLFHSMARSERSARIPPAPPLRRPDWRWFLRRLFPPNPLVGRCSTFAAEPTTPSPSHPFSLAPQPITRATHSQNSRNPPFARAAYHSCTHSTSDVKELLPEFFYLPDLLLNRNSLPLGTRQDGQQVGDVLLPPWANDATDFIAKHRAALESEHVSAHLHEWIDLIFGYKQRGKAAEEAINVFFYLTYEGNVNLSALTDPQEVKVARLKAQLHRHTNPCSITGALFPVLHLPLHLP